MRSHIRLVLFLLIAISTIGCTQALIPNTDVIDTPLNRDIVKFCETYRRAVERQNIGQLLEMAHPNYYEDGGTLDPTDDMDRAGLADYLRQKYTQADSVRYEIRYRHVSNGRRGEFLVDYTYSASFRIPTSRSSEWRRKVADNRLEVVPDGDKFLIVSGM